jgi:putative transcriptional regulator
MGKRRMRIADVVKVTGLHRETVTQLYYDRKERFTRDLLDRLCTALSCQPADLIEYISDNEGIK